MKKLAIFLLMVTLSLFAQESINAGQSESKDQSLEEVINQIITINKQLNVVKNKDTNSTLNKEYQDGIIAKKDKLISQIPRFINYENYKSSFNKLSYEKELKALKRKLDINSKAGYKNAFLRDSIAVERLNTDVIFYEFLEKMKDYSDQTNLKNSFKSLIEQSLFALQAIDIPKLVSKEKLSLLENTTIEKLEDDRLTLVAARDSYIQILEYFYKNIGLISSNYLFTQLDINYFVSAINDIIPFKNKYINPGKIAFCILVLGVCWLLVLLLRKRKFLIFIFPFSKIAYTHRTKESIIRSTNRPLIALLILFAFKICFIVLYHPYALGLSVKTVFSIALICLLSLLVIGISKGYGIAYISMMEDDDNSFRKDVVNLILRIIYFLVIIIALLLILSELGVNVSAIIASLGIGGLAVAWASKDILANFFASILLLIDNSFSQGDWIESKDISGTVVEIGLRRTTVRTFDNSLLFVPNSVLANEPIRNWTRRKVGRRIKMNIGLTYDSSKEKLALCVKDIRDMLLNHKGIANPEDISLSPKDYKESFRQHVVSITDLKGYKRTLLVYLDSFGDSSINILVYCFSNSTNWEEWLKIKQDVMLKIIDIVDKHGLSFAFPSQSLYIESMPKRNLQEQILNQNDIKED